VLRESLVDSVWTRSVVVGGGKEEILSPPIEYSKHGAKDRDPSFIVVLKDTRDISIRLLLLKKERKKAGYSQQLNVNENDTNRES
jgi:hypothetical protein